MARWVRWGASALVLGLMLMLLPACSKEHAAGKPPPHAQTEAAKARVALKITSYGPDKVAAGQTFNLQPSGNAALWIRVDRSLDGSDAAVYFDGKRLNSAISGTLITAGVPVDLYARPGTYQVYVAASYGNAILHSNIVTVVVQ